MSSNPIIRMKSISDLSASIHGSLKYLQQEQETLEKAQRNIAAEQERITEKTQRLKALVSDIDLEPEA